MSINIHLVHFPSEWSLKLIMIEHAKKLWAKILLIFNKILKLDASRNNTIRQLIQLHVASKIWFW